jgi:hypothetical protein
MFLIVVGKVRTPSRGVRIIAAVHAAFMVRAVGCVGFRRRIFASTEQEERMKKVLALAVIAVFCAVVGLANQHMEGKTVEGTITKVDATAKSMVVKTADGKETTFYWSDTTKVMGTPKEGETVHIKAVEKDGKMWANAVHVGKMEKK